MTFPSKYRLIIEEVCRTFAHSSKRKVQLELILSARKSPFQRIIKYVETRWTSYSDALKRILSVFESLQEFYNLYGTKHERLMLTEESRLMLELLSILMDSLVLYIKLFETENLTADRIRQILQECKLFMAQTLIDLRNDDRKGPVINLKELEVLMEYNDEELKK